MSRLIRLTLLLIVTCAAAIFTTHLIGGTRPNPLAILFTNPDGTPCQRPCLLGVGPGETKYEDAVALLRTHPFMLQFDQREENAANGLAFSGHKILVILQGKPTNSVSSSVSSLLISFLSPTNTLYSFARSGDLIDILDKPTSFMLSDNLECEAWYIYMDDGIMASTSSTKYPYIDKDEWLAFISLSEKNTFSSFIPPDRISWNGFRDYPSCSVTP